jgi:Glycosyl hydrolase 36 superfamily, catalytic domain
VQKSAPPDAFERVSHNRRSGDYVNRQDRLRRRKIREYGIVAPAADFAWHLLNRFARPPVFLLSGGPDAPACREAKNSWLTGTAAWNLVAITQWILGIRAEMDGLRVDPVLPAAWTGFTATRRFRGATYRISVRNPDRISGRVANLEVDGRLVRGTLVPLAPAGTTVRVEAVVR